MIFKNFKSKKKLMKEIEELKLQNAIACSNISSLENIIHARLDQKPVALKERKIERISVLYSFLNRRNEEPPLHIIKDRLARELAKEMQRMNCVEYDVAEDGSGKIGGMSATVYVTRKL